MTLQRWTRLFVIGGSVVGLCLFLSWPLLSMLQRWQQLSAPDFQLSRVMYQEMSGRDRPSKTLLVFVNNAEQRVGGGFVGTVGLLEGENGKLRLSNVRSVYFYDHRIENKGSFITPPSYLRSLVPFIAARDSLISPDPKQNAVVFRDLFAREAGIYADNVVQVTPEFLKVILRYTGPVKLDEYNLTVSADTITSDLQLEVESGIDKQSGRDPKTVLAVLAGRLMAKLPDIKPDQLAALQKDLIRLLPSRQAYVVSANTSLMQRVNMYQQMRVEPGAPNTVLISAANYNATKSSQAIRQTSELELIVGADGKQELQITITRQHTRDYEGEYIEPRTGRKSVLIGDDLSWITLYLPVGTRNLNPDGWEESSNQAGITFSKSVLTKPKTTTQLQATLQLPERVVLTDSIRLQQHLLSQFGWFGQDYRVTLRAPVGYRVANAQGGEELADGRSVRYTGNQINDKVFESVFAKIGS